MELKFEHMDKDPDYTPMFLGRNGIFKESGLKITDDFFNRGIRIEPITSRGRVGRSWVMIPYGDLPALIAALEEQAALCGVQTRRSGGAGILGETDLTREFLAEHGKLVVDQVNHEEYEYSGERYIAGWASPRGENPGKWHVWRTV